MRKIVFFLIGMIIAGAAAYFGAYYLYVSQHPKVVLETPVTLKHGITDADQDAQVLEQEYFLAKIEQEMLMIYKMPEESIYDSLKINNLQIQLKDYPKLLDGMAFSNLSEVYDFLEGCMS